MIGFVMDLCNIILSEDYNIRISQLRYCVSIKFVAEIRKNG